MLAVKPYYYEQIRKLEKRKAVTALNLGQHTNFMARYEHELESFPSVKAVLRSEKDLLERRIDEAEEEIQTIYERVQQNRINGQGYATINTQI
ncbi:hypothetical protein U3A55_02355 [Salarchaeum sp. III]